MQGKNKGAWMLILIILWGVGWTGCERETPSQQDPVLPPLCDATLTAIGGDRPAAVYMPKSFDCANTYPLVVLLHGYSVNGFMQNLVLNIVERVSDFDFVLIVPEGTKDARELQFWNAFSDCCNFDNLDVDDVAYLAGLVEEIQQYVHVDSDRISFVGHSNGGYMTYRMACERPDLVRRMVVLAGSMPVNEQECPNTSDPVRLLHIHGTNDTVVPWANNVNGTPGDGHGLISKGAADSVARWRLINGCDDTMEETHTDFFPKEGDETIVRRWSSCADDGIVEQWDVEGGDHLLLGGNKAFKDGIVTFMVGP